MSEPNEPIAPEEISDLDKLYEIFTTRYLTKREIMYRLPPGFKLNEFWPKFIEYRKKIGKKVPLLDQLGENFWLCPTPYQEQLDIIEKHAKHTAYSYIDAIFKKVPKSEKALIMDALIDEAFNSSVIEGAFSTKKRSKELIEKQIKPVNVSEQMILNNYKALEYVLENIHKEIDENTVLEVYRIITQHTLDKESICEKYRDDSVIVWDYTNQRTIYEGPPHTEVQPMMDDLIHFIQSKQNLHPVEKASIIHFYFVYTHPFFDGNGRTARVFQYMYLLQHGYEFFKFFSISTVINEQKNKYYKAIQNTEDNSSDLTYFIEFNIKMMIDSIINVLSRLGKEYGRLLIFDYLERNVILLTIRQRKCLAYFIKTERNYITISEYEKKYKISYETARKDLNRLEEIGLFKKRKVGKKYIYKFIGLEKLGLGQFAITKQLYFNN